MNGVPNVPPTGTAILYTAPFTLTTPGSVTINAMAIGSGYSISQLASATYTVSTTAANFTTAVAPASVSISPGSSAIVAITLKSEYGFTSPVTFSCTTVPANVLCTFNPATVTPTNGQSVTTALTMYETNSASLQHHSNPFLPGGVTFALAFCFLGWKKRRALVLTLVLIAGAVGASQLTGCGNNQSAAPTQTTVVVTATSGTITQTIQVSLTLNN